MKTIIAIATYNEKNNIRELIARIRLTLGAEQPVLIIDDNSPDGTSDEIRAMKLSDNAIDLITRPGKRGLGSAHKLMKVYAIVNNYDFLVTMDADLSHRPEEIPSLLAHAGKNTFVIGSRYVPGGKSDYVGLRNVVSVCGNFLARTILKINLKEFTTSFRVFDVSLLKKAPLSRLRNNGYSYFIEVVSLMDELGAKLIEIPIHFKDRENDVSKIPKFQAVISLFNLFKLAVLRHLKPLRQNASAGISRNTCRSCGKQVLIPLWQTNNNENPSQQLSSEDFNCSSIQSCLKKPDLQECLCCGLIQCFPHELDQSIEDLYFATQDSVYLSNFTIKIRTFKNAFKKISPFLPTKRLNFLDIGSYYGAFLEIVKSEGHSGYGIEPSQNAAHYSKEFFGHTVLNESFKGAQQFAEIHFDVVTAWDVIEHLENPDDFLAKIENYVGDDGLFVCSTIIIDSFVARILKRNWHWIMPMHLTYFKKHDITELLNKHNFQVIAYTNHTHYASLSYALKGVGMNMPPLLNAFCNVVASIVPSSFVVPIALGDVKMLVCRKMMSPDR